MIAVITNGNNVVVNNDRKKLKFQHNTVKTIRFYNFDGR